MLAIPGEFEAVRSGVAAVDGVTLGARMTAKPGARVPTVFVVDVDGVMTDGTFWYDETGKVLKRFGPDDSDALALLREHMTIEFVSADARGFPITRKRIVDDMGYPLFEVPSGTRLHWIAQRHGLDAVVYMGDGIFDPPILRGVAYGIAPADADPEAIAAADLVTQRPGGRRAVSEACLHLLERFFAVDVASADEPIQAT
jgi:3-deoxy-D-manno-octulosonate 8-phosphate phosphatase (KDO 8-P phosphatase)